MKTQLLRNKAGAAALALIATIGIAPTAKAIVLAYESDPDGAGPLTIGSPYSGTVQIKFVAFDNGTNYPTPPPAATGYSGSPGAGVAGGITAVNGIVGQTPAGNAFPGTISPATNEDSWGVGRITNIQTPGGVDVWTPLGKGTELTALFRGEQDFRVEPDPNNPGFDTRVSGAGYRLDIWEDGTPGGTVDPTTQFNPALGPAGRTSAANFTTATDGTLQLSLASTPGFIQTNTGAGGPAPGFGGAATEFSETFNFGSLSGLGTAFFNVIGGAQAGLFDTNSITSPAGTFNAGAGIIPSPFADFRANFTVQPGQFGFLVTANDPLVGSAAVPEPSTLLAGFACLLPMLRRNRRKAI